MLSLNPPFPHLSLLIGKCALLIVLLYLLLYYTLLIISPFASCCSWSSLSSSYYYHIRYSCRCRCPCPCRYPCRYCPSLFLLPFHFPPPLLRLLLSPRRGIDNFAGRAPGIFLLLCLTPRSTRSPTWSTRRTRLLFRRARAPLLALFRAHFPAEPHKFTAQVFANE